MKARGVVWLVLVAVACVFTPMTPAGQDKPQVQIPKPGVPQIMTMEGNFVRAAYNNEGYVILGYQLANRSLGEEWMLLEVGMTVLNRTPDYTLKREPLARDARRQDAPVADSQRVPRPPTPRHCRAREKVQRDSINYFPPMASRPCRIGFFSDLDSGAMPYDQVDLSDTRACLGRLYFRVPGGIAYGQHWLNVKFEKSLVRVPFRILTKEEEKLLSRNYKDIRKQVEDTFKKKG